MTEDQPAFSTPTSSSPLLHRRNLVDVILPAAGTSSRMGAVGACVPKQFQKVLGTHLIAYTVECFQRIAWIRHIVLVVSPSQEEYALGLAKIYDWSKVKVVPGGPTRHRSIKLGVEALKDACSDDSVVIVHDGARPFVPEDIIENVVAAAREQGAAGVVRPLVSTVVKPDKKDILESTLIRTDYRNSEMPQAFQYHVIAKAYQLSTEDDLDFGTECLLLALEHSSCPARLVNGHPDLWKVTYAKDLFTMESVVKEKHTRLSMVVKPGQPPAYLENLTNRLQERQITICKANDSAANATINFLDLPDALTLASCSKPYCKWIRHITCHFKKLPRIQQRLGLYIVLVFMAASPEDKNENSASSNAHVDFNVKDCIFTNENMLCGTVKFIDDSSDKDESNTVQTATPHSLSSQPSNSTKKSRPPQSEINAQTHSSSSPSTPGRISSSQSLPSSLSSSSSSTLPSLSQSLRQQHHQTPLSLQPLLQQQKQLLQQQQQQLQHQLKLIQERQRLVEQQLLANSTPFPSVSNHKQTDIGENCSHGDSTPSNPVQQTEGVSTVVESIDNDKIDNTQTYRFHESAMMNGNRNNNIDGIDLNRHQNHNHGHCTTVSTKTMDHKSHTQKQPHFWGGQVDNGDAFEEEDVYNHLTPIAKAVEPTSNTNCSDFITKALPTLTGNHVQPANHATISHNTNNRDDVLLSRSLMSAKTLVPYIPVCKDYMKEVCHMIRQCDSSISDICITSILNQNTEDLTEKLVELVWNRSRVLHGQVLIT